MKHKFAFFVRWLALTVVLFLSGCSTYHQSTSSLPAINLQTVHSESSPIQNGSLEYYRFGHGSPIILIPGYVTDVSSWNREFLITLAQQHQVILLNNRNVGRSVVHSSRYDSKDLATDTYQLIQNLNLKKPAVLGISMGGMIAQQLAVLYPKKLGQLILINTAIAGKKSVHPSPAVEKQMLNMPTNKLGRYLLAIDLFFPAQWKMKMAFAMATTRFQPQDCIEVNPTAIMSQQRNLIFHWVDDNQAARKLSKLNLPTLILNGEADIVIPPVNSIILARTIPHARLVRWKEGGHAMNYQYPQEMAKTINYFIAETR